MARVERSVFVTTILASLRDAILAARVFRGFPLRSNPRLLSAIASRSGYDAGGVTGCSRVDAEGVADSSRGAQCSGDLTGCQAPQARGGHHQPSTVKLSIALFSPLKVRPCTRLNAPHVASEHA